MKTILLMLIAWAGAAQALTIEPYGGSFLGHVKYQYAPPFNVGAPGSYSDKLGAVTVGARLTQNFSVLFLGLDYQHLMDGKNTVDKSVPSSGDSKFTLDSYYAVGGFGSARGVQIYFGYSPELKLYDKGVSADSTLLGSATKVGVGLPIWFLRLQLEYVMFDFKKFHSAGVTSSISSFYKSFDADGFSLSLGIPIHLGF